MQVWLAEATAQQRTLLVSRHEPQRGVETSDVVLSFSASAGRCTLSVLHASDLVWTHMQRLSSPSVPLLGILGLLKMGTDTYLACITHAERVGSLHADQWIRRVRGVTFFCINRAVRDEEFQYGIDPQEYGRSTTSSAPAENPCASIRKYMNSGSFFFAERCAFDLTRRFARIELHSDMDQQFSSQFAWNTYMMEPILQFRTRLDPSQRAELDSAALLVLVIQGYVGMASFPLGPERRDKGTLAVISRLSARRAGTRFNARGIDDQGYAANFAETETVLAFGEDVMSFVQVRGSVPLFWEQQGLQALNARIQITRVGAATQLAFEQHMQRLLDEYERVFALDLLGTRDAETMLSQGYVQHIDAMLAHLPLHGDEKPLRYYNFDFHTITKVTGGLDGTRAELDRLNNVQTQRQYNGYTVAQYHPNYVEHVMTQTGVFRVNCFDCLDRTNVVQGCLSHAALRDFFRTLAREKYDDANLALLRDTPGLPEALWPLHGRLWAENGDTLSQISTGTGSLNSDYTRSGSKKFFAGLLSDAAKSASRYVASLTQHVHEQFPGPEQAAGHRHAARHAQWAGAGRAVRPGVHGRRRGARAAQGRVCDAETRPALCWHLQRVCTAAAAARGVVTGGVRRRHRGALVPGAGAAHRAADAYLVSCRADAAVGADGARSAAHRHRIVRGTAQRAAVCHGCAAARARDDAAARAQRRGRVQKDGDARHERQQGWHCRAHGHL